MPYAYIAAARFLGACIASGALVGLVAAIIKAVWRG